MPDLSNLCFVGVGNPKSPEHIYVEILRDELGYVGNLLQLVPSPDIHLIQTMRDRKESVFVIIGSAELSMGKFLVFYKFMEAFQIVSKEGVRALLSYEAGQDMVKRLSSPRPNTPETAEKPLEGATPKN